MNIQFDKNSPVLQSSKGASLSVNSERAIVRRNRWKQAKEPAEYQTGEFPCESETTPSN